MDGVRWEGERGRGQEMSLWDSEMPDGSYTSKNRGVGGVNGSGDGDTLVGWQMEARERGEDGEYTRLRRTASIEVEDCGMA